MTDYWDWKKREGLADQALTKANTNLINELNELRQEERGRRVPFAQELIDRVRVAEQARRTAFDAWLDVCAASVPPPLDR